MTEIVSCNVCNSHRDGPLKLTSRTGYIGRDGSYCGHAVGHHMYAGCQCNYNEALINPEKRHPDIYKCSNCEGKKVITKIKQNRNKEISGYEYKCVNCEQKSKSDVL